MAKQESMTSGQPGNLQDDPHPEEAQAEEAQAAGAATVARRRPHRLLLAIAAAIIAVAAAIVAIGGTSGGPPKAAADPPARSFTLPRLGHAGEHVSLAELAGKPVIINFFASWCTPCQKETPLLARFYRAHRGIALIGVDANDKTLAAQRFTRAAGVSYPVGFDPYPMSTTIGYGVAALPQTFFLNARHRIVKRIFGAVTEQQLTAGLALITKQAK
jgi:cytochrome c biogenesis protein CcmG/thiol:disulfide interchange protein DsbE